MGIIRMRLYKHISYENGYELAMVALLLSPAIRVMSNRLILMRCRKAIYCFI